MNWRERLDKAAAIVEEARTAADPPAEAERGLTALLADRNEMTEAA